MGQELDPSGSRLGVLLQELEASAEEALGSGGDRKAKVTGLALLSWPLRSWHHLMCVHCNCSTHAGQLEGHA